MDSPRVLAIDPGDQESAFTLIAADGRPILFDKLRNEDMRAALRDETLHADVTGVEMVASYGMPVGAEVFETCVWIGRFAETITWFTGREPSLVKRIDVKMHHCHTSRAKDAHIRQALVDRFAKGQPNYGKGTKAIPGWFYGFYRDIWQAYALAVHLADIEIPAATIEQVKTARLEGTQFYI